MLISLGLVYSSNIISFVAHGQVAFIAAGVSGFRWEVGGLDDVCKISLGSLKTVTVQCTLKFVGNMDRQILHFILDLSVFNYRQNSLPAAELGLN